MVWGLPRCVWARESTPQTVACWAPLTMGPWLPLETRPDSPGEPGMQPRDPCLPWRGIVGPGHALPSPNAPGKAPNHIHTTLRWGTAPGKPSRADAFRAQTPRWLSSVEATCNAVEAGDKGSILASGRSSGSMHGNLLQYSCLENPMDKGAWWVIVHGVAHEGALPPPCIVRKDPRAQGGVPQRLLGRPA